MKAPIKILLIVLLVAITQPTNAHWDDWWSDGSHMLDEVTCTAEDLSNKDDDWYRRNDDITKDYSDNSYSNNDNYGSYRNNSNSSLSTIRIAGSNTNNDNGDAYTLQTTDKLVKPLADMPKPGYKQELKNTCILAGINFSLITLLNKNFGELNILNKVAIPLGLNSISLISGEFNSKDFLYIIEKISEYFGLKTISYITDISDAIDNGIIVLSAIENMESNDYHNIVIVGYTNDVYCEYYIYYDTSDGEYKIIDQSDVTLYYIGLK